MATRQVRVSVDHVRALSSIDLAFYGRRVLGFIVRGSRAQAVLDAWHDYHAHLSLPADRRPQNEAQQRDWDGRGHELFTNLLDRLAVATNFKFDRNLLKVGSYSPEAHAVVEREQHELRQLALKVMSGTKPLPMEVRAWPVDPEATTRQANMQEQLIENQKVALEKPVEILHRLSDRHDARHDTATAADVPAQNEAPAE